MILNTAAFFGEAMRFQLYGIGMTIFDIIGAAAALAMLVLLLARATSNLHKLAQLEPPRA
jgi:hypothetical protein